ncbi:hypothetical protein G5T42_15405 [Microbacterium sp. 4R-513]|uniref:hypothetical protein n=1 Tax=Microbacterium sp. 4R-513 TaxID=2567934 RepID=UPI0013E163A8|nr:hypothetical protein [Microbacterium sp. 4R-513]QIG40687.1 hypothetical protein G5T42_15405 [Microbacterium sp. 4R-513]
MLGSTTRRIAWLWTLIWTPGAISTVGLGQHRKRNHLAETRNAIWRQEEEKIAEKRKNAANAKKKTKKTMERRGRKSEE